MRTYLQASIAAFYVTHSSAEGASSSVASSSTQPPPEDPEDLVTPWLVRSPPEVTTKELASKFLEVKCTQPALQAAEPVQVSLLN